MGFLKDLGKLAGGIAGAAVSTPLAIAGGILGSDFLTEIGEAAFELSVAGGGLLGDVAEGVVDIVSETVNSEIQKQSGRSGNIINNGTIYANDPINSIDHAVKNEEEDPWNSMDIDECYGYDYDDDDNWSARDIAEYYGYVDDDDYGYEQFLDDM